MAQVIGRRVVSRAAMEARRAEQEALSSPVPGHGLSHAPGFECGAAARAAAPSGQVADEVGGVGD